MNAWRWFVLAGGALMLGVAWEFVKAKSKTANVPNSMRAIASASFSVGVVEAVRQSLFLWVALAIGTIIFSLEYAIPDLRRFFSINSGLYFIVPYLLGAGVSSISTRGNPGRVIGTLLIACGLFVIGFKLFDYKFLTLQYHLDVPANSQSGTFHLGPGDIARWDQRGLDRVGLYDYTHRQYLFECTKAPWESAQNQGKSEVLLGFISCNSTRSSIVVNVAHF